MNIEELSADWAELGKKVGLTEDQLKKQWQNWQSNYQAKGRAYHNLTHIGHAPELSHWPGELIDKTSIQLAICFTTTFTRPPAKTTKSKARNGPFKFLWQWQYPAEIIAKIEAMILATAGHKDEGLDEDGRVFLDLDLAILDRIESVMRSMSQRSARESGFIRIFSIAKDAGRFCDIFWNGRSYTSRLPAEKSGKNRPGEPGLGTGSFDLKPVLCQSES